MAYVQSWNSHTILIIVFIYNVGLGLTGCCLLPRAILNFILIKFATSFSASLGNDKHLHTIRKFSDLKNIIYCFPLAHLSHSDKLKWNPKIQFYWLLRIRVYFFLYISSQDVFYGFKTLLESLLEKNYFHKVTICFVCFSLSSVRVVFLSLSSWQEYYRIVHAHTAAGIHCMPDTKQIKK